jgi:poly(hydroxyalkanoate) depolymerase family esterase
MNDMRWSRQFRIGRRQMRRAFRAMSEMMNAPWTAPTAFASFAAQAAGVVELAEFGSNPGGLRMLVQAPGGPPAAGAPLVMVLHGCGQEAASFAEASGWSGLAERLGFPLLLPEQPEANNRHRCFNWFRPADVRRGRGEVLSLRQMVGEAVTRFGSDPRQVFVVGLSAGGAMAAALLAAYPDVFAGGAVMAGLPVGCATNASQALGCMAHAPPAETPEAWAERARAAAPVRFAGPWPILSIWQGEADRVVAPDNADRLAAQWTALHGLALAEAREDRPAPQARRLAWGDPDHPAVEQWSIARLGHGVPIDAEVAGTAMPFVIDARIDAPAAVARFWGIA